MKVGTIILKVGSFVKHVMILFNADPNFTLILMRALHLKRIALQTHGSNNV